MNRAQVAGWLTDVPEYGMTNGGKTYANFTIGIMASKKPTNKEIVAKVEVLTRVNIPSIDY